jgi:RNA polymerase sigma factor (sigma-70 family)
MSSPEPSREPAGVVLSRLVENRHDFLAFLQRRLGSRALAEDILQEAFARSLTKVSELENDESAVAWFYRILRNAVIDHQRRSGTATRGLERLSHELAEPSAEVETAVCQCVKGVTATLKPEYAAVLQAVEVEGQTVKDFAETAGISAGNAAVRVFRAREALKQRLVSCCGSCADDHCRDCTCHTSSAAESP